MPFLLVVFSCVFIKERSNLSFEKEETPPLCLSELTLGGARPQGSSMAVGTAPCTSGENCVYLRGI